MYAGYGIIVGFIWVACLVVANMLDTRKMLPWLSNTLMAVVLFVAPLVWTVLTFLEPNLGYRAFGLVSALLWAICGTATLLGWKRGTKAELYMLDAVVVVAPLLWCVLNIVRFFKVI